MNRFFATIWGGASSILARTRRLGWIDLLVVAGVVGLVFGSLSVGREWAGPLHEKVEIDLSPLALPRYALYSLARGLLAYALSLGFTLAYGYWAAKDRRAERVLIPLLDVLQSIPVLGFLPGFVLAFVSIFPSRNVGLELAAVLMIFTSQAWNMTFSFYQSLRSVPADLREASRAFRFGPWQTFTGVELRFATAGLVWNSMMSMAGGWFFLMVAESFVLGERDFRLPGLGSYMSVAVARGDAAAMAWALVTMVGLVIGLDQFLWRPLVAWAQRYRVEESVASEKATSWVLDWLRRSRVVSALGDARRGLARVRARRTKRRPASRPTAPARASSGVALAAIVALLASLAFGAWKVVALLGGVPLAEWWDLLLRAVLTLGRVLLSTALATAWTVPVGLWIGLSPRRSRSLQPLVQIAASFPAPMVFPLAILAMRAVGLSLDWGSVVLMLMGTQWYVLFNVIAGATAIPGDLREVSGAFRIGRWQRFWTLQVPAILPYLVTGWVTAAGGAWNASIVAEYVGDRGETITAHGLGAAISRAAEHANYPTLAAAVTIMSVFVVLFNAAVWHRLYRLAETRFSLSK